MSERVSNEKVHYWGQTRIKIVERIMKDAPRIRFLEDWVEDDNFKPIYFSGANEYKKGYEIPLAAEAITTKPHKLDENGYPMGDEL